MLSTLQIFLLVINCLLAVSAIIFTILSIVEMAPRKRVKTRKVSIKNIIETNKEQEKESQISVEEMLENLEQESTEEIEVVEEEPVQEVVEIVEEVVIEQPKENAEEIVVEEVEEQIEEVKEEVVEETKIEELAELSDSNDDTDSEDDDDDDIALTYEKMDKDVVLAPGTIIDYKTRLERVVENKSKLEKDLHKIQKAILKYERTERRKTRNEKMLDRRAGELTNLNLLMYSVTDIKNVDEDKKVKQEELTSHIAELKASIQDAEEYLDSNREKYNHNVKMAKFLIQERIRFKEEIVELEALIKNTEENK